MLVERGERGLHVVHDRLHLDPVGAAERHAHELREETFVVDDHDAYRAVAHGQFPPPALTWVASAATTAASSSPRATAPWRVRTASLAETAGRSPRSASSASN